MNQNNSRDRFWKMMEQNQFVKSINSVTDKVEKYPPAIVDMEATVAINGEFDKHAIDEWLHQELQKARAEVYKKLTDQLYGMNLNITMAEQQNMFRELDYVFNKMNQSELDQPLPDKQ